MNTPIEIDLDNFVLTESILRQLEIATPIGDTIGLLPFAQISPRELQMMDEAMGMWATSRELSISIGKGVNYAVSHSGKHGGFVKVIYRAQDSCFSLPLTVEIWTSHEPQSPEEHHDACPYFWEDWPKDEDGEHYWVDGYAEDGERHYEPECYCDYVEDDHAEITIGDGDDLALVTAKIEELWSKL